MFTGARKPVSAWTVVIGGGGVPGLALALALSRAAGRAVSVSVVDPSGAAPADGRAYALSPASVAVLDALGVWAAVRPHTVAVTAMTITDGRAADVVRPDYLGFAGPSGEPLARMVEGRYLLPPLIEAARAAGVQFRSGTVDEVGLGPGARRVRLSDGSRLDAALLVAADGARSRLRAQAGIGWVGGPYRQRAITGTVRHARPHGGRAVQHFLPGGPFAILPLPDEVGRHRSSVVWTEREERVSVLTASDPASFASELSERFGRDLGAIEPEGPPRDFPLSLGLARRFVAERLALVGDSAHEIHPLAGQGLNLGLMDAASLAERVVDAVRLGLDPGSAEILRGYERDRRFDAVRLAALTDGLNRLFSNDLLPLRFVRDLGLGLLDRSGSIKRTLLEAAAGTGRRAPRLARGLTL